MEDGGRLRGGRFLLHHDPEMTPRISCSRFLESVGSSAQLCYRTEPVWLIFIRSRLLMCARIGVMFVLSAVVIERRGFDRCRACRRYCRPDVARTTGRFVLSCRSRSEGVSCLPLPRHLDQGWLPIRS